MVQSFLTLLVGLLPISSLKPPLLSSLGHRVAASAKIGVSLLLCETLYLGPNTRIGHLNVIAPKRLLMREGAAIGSMNFLRAQASVLLSAHAEIGNRNKLTRGFVPGIPEPSQFRLGENSKLTASHTVDLGDSVIVGRDTVIGGLATQIWTHGFIHQRRSTERIYIRSKVLIGSGCFIGSRACISSGTVIGNFVSIGAQSSISGRLEAPGVYVSEKLRHLQIDPTSRVEAMTPIKDAENAYKKIVVSIEKDNPSID